MSKIHKSKMTVDGNSVHVSMPFAKVDKANRLVSGYATLDNIDTQGDIVEAEASVKAFARARGNIREMHQPIAVGKMVDFREDELFDPETKQLYRGIFVTARVSEGAEDTWKKVLDETLTGFSIGGEIKEVDNKFVKEAGRTIRFIKDYDLTELSLVDNPANQLANVLSIQKSSNGSTIVKMGEVSDAEIETVFICKADSTVTVKSADADSSCPTCGIKMEEAGWFESGGNRSEKVQSIVAKFLNPGEKEAAPTSEGGVVMGKKNTAAEANKETAKEVSVVNPSETTETGEKIEETEETSVPVEEEESADVDETDGTEEEESADAPDEVTDDADEISKKIDALHTAVKDSLAESHEETAKKVSALEKKIDEATESFLNKASELESKMGEFGEKLEVSKNRLVELESRLEKMNSSDAVKKSADLETETVEKSVQDTSWNGAFSGRPSRGFSVSNLT